jgi:iron complex outermembrane receptor protein
MFIKTNYQVTDATSIFLDFQLRSVKYEFNGNDVGGGLSNQKVTLVFFNPKFGLTHKINDEQLFYGSFAIANKEPNRSDYVESSPNSRPLYETLYDTEIGFRYKSKNLTFNTNLYLMNYENQLIKTGEINDVGYFTSNNVKSSYRRGVEIEGRCFLTKKLSWAANITLSKNKLDTMTQFIDNWDTGGQEEILHQNTDLAFSPNIIWSSKFLYNHNDNISLGFISKYVGKQYIDNTSSDGRKLDDYLTSNLQLDYNFKSKIFKTIKMSVLINNIFDNEYISNAWLYRFISEGFDPRESDHYITKGVDNRFNMAGYFPQATRNYLFGLTLEF